MGNPDALLRNLKERLQAPVRLVWTANHTVYLSLRPAGESWTLRLHHCFRDAPKAVWGALERFLRSGQRRWLAPARAHFVQSTAGEPRPERRLSLRPEGCIHHLGEILAEVQDQPVFAGLPPVGITWGRRARPGRRHVRLGSYQAGPPPLIRIHPVLDDDRVPGCVVAQVVHHELVHHCLGHRAGAAAGRKHGRAFCEMEASFPEGRRALEWQERNLRRLLAARRR